MSNLIRLFAKRQWGDRTTFDTNIYVSALRGGKVALRLLQLAREGAFALQISVSNSATLIWPL